MKRLQIFLLATLTLLAACAQKSIADSKAATPAASANSAKAGHDVDVVILGDSNIWLGGDNCDNSKGWTYYFAQRYAPRSIHSYARSGASWTNHPNTVADMKEYTELLTDNNVIYNQVLRLQEAVKSGKQPTPQLIIVAAGGNDAWFHARRPGIFTPGAKSKKTGLPTSLAGSVRYNCQMLQKSFPKARIVLMTPHQMTKPDPKVLKQVSDTIEAVGKEMNLTVIRTDIDGPTSREQELKGFVNSYDGVHTSVQGAKKTADYVIGKIN